MLIVKSTVSCLSLCIRRGCGPQQKCLFSFANIWWKKRKGRCQTCMVYEVFMVGLARTFKICCVPFFVDRFHPVITCWCFALGMYLTTLMKLFYGILWIALNRFKPPLQGTLDLVWLGCCFLIGIPCGCNLYALSVQCGQAFSVVCVIRCVCLGVTT